jgi:hypothetical protein
MTDAAPAARSAVGDETRASGGSRASSRPWGGGFGRDDVDQGCLGPGAPAQVSAASTVRRQPLCSTATTRASFGRRRST